MKITLDHNCIIHLENETDVGRLVRLTVQNRANRCFVVNVGASEMLRFGVTPDNYDAFEKLLVKAGIDHLPRLDPICIWDFSFWDRCVFAEEDDSRLLEAIQGILFGEAEVELGESKVRNRLCDALTMWCHITHRNDVFLTTDGNFFKATKKPRLIELGAGSILHPRDA